MIRFTPTPEQRQILDLGLTSIRISAGAGTGKTTTVAMVISNLVANHGIEPEQILGVTFTNKAASELADRVRQYLGPEVIPGREVEVHTYHGFAGQILSEFGLLAGLDRRPEVITPTFSRQLLSETFYNTEYREIDITWHGHIDRIKQLGDRLGDHLLEPSDLLETPHASEGSWAARSEMLETLKRYQEDKRSLSVVDYSDLITMSTKLVQGNESIAATIRDRYRAVVLDEYQDTNPGQRILLATIFGKNFPVIAVGDVDQTIYEWRGASAENFENFQHHFSRPDGDKPHLEQLTDNYRSGQNILDIANEIRLKANPGASRLTSPENASGKIETFWAGDAMGEAEWIARRFEELHEEGIKWSDMAVLFRKNKDFPMVIEALARHDIPMEVANLGGLLSVPEISEIRSWMTLIARPHDAAAVLHVLTGSSYRLGLADLAPVSRWIGQQQSVYLDGLPDRTIIEGIERLDDIDGLRREAIDAYRHFYDTYLALLTEAQGASLVEVARMILDRTRAWSDVESLPPVPRLTARLNLYRFLDLAEDWSPLRGRSSLPVFLDYLDVMEEQPAEELDAARLSGEDAVSLVTVHRAKGLEWEVVAIPSVTHGNFPGGSQMHPDPETQASVLPIQFRVDSLYSDLPEEPKARLEFFREINLNQEWRVAYVAATRAKSHLMVSGAHWYGHPEPTVNAKKPSVLFDLVDQHPRSVSAGKAEEPPRPQLLRYEPSIPDPDPHFPDGWVEALRTSMADPSHLERLASDIGVEDTYASEVDRWSTRLFELPAELVVDREEDGVTVSVTGLVTYANCPKRFFWSEIDPLPRKKNLAAMRGTEVHRRIELYQKGTIPLEEISEQIYDLSEGEGGPGAFANFKKSRFGQTPARYVEAPFTLSVNDSLRVRGRIDAIYVDRGRWEVVDFKSGKPSSDPARLVQLEAYAVACTDVDFGSERAESMQVTFAYLGGEVVEEPTEVTDVWLEEARAHLEGMGSAILAEEFDPSPSPSCDRCDFLRFCPAGQAFLAT